MLCRNQETNQVDLKSKVCIQTYLKRSERRIALQGLTPSLLRISHQIQSTETMKKLKHTCQTFLLIRVGERKWKADAQVCRSHVTFLRHKKFFGSSSLTLSISLQLLKSESYFRKLLKSSEHFLIGMLKSLACITII